MDKFNSKEVEAIKEGTKLNALELSLKKHQDIINGEGADLGSYNCALCVKYWEEEGTECEECPLCLDGNACIGIGSLWDIGDTAGLIEVFERLIKLEENYEKV